MPEATTKRCSRCGESKPLDEYRVLKSGYLISHCRACAKEYLAAWRIKNAASLRESRKQRYQDYKRDATPEERARKREQDRLHYVGYADVQRNLYLLSKFGITLVEYRQISAAQGGVCAICGKPCKSGRSLAVDHDHATGLVRGLLCINCNNGLGNFGDDSELLAAAADYLKTKGS